MEVGLSTLENLLVAIAGNVNPQEIVLHYSNKQVDQVEKVLWELNAKKATVASATLYTIGEWRIEVRRNPASVTICK